MWCSEQQSQPAAATLQAKESTEHTPTVTGRVSISSQHLYLCPPDEAPFISKCCGAAQGVELSLLRVGGGWALRGSSPCPPMAGSARRWETRRQPARNPCTGGRELFSPLGSALLLAGKCAFKAQLTKEEQENKMQIRGEINFRRVSFVIMTQLFRGRQHSSGSIKGTSPYPLMNSFLSVPLDVWGGHRFAWHQSCLPRHLPVAVTKANKIQKSCCFLHSSGFGCLMVTSVSVVDLMRCTRCLCPRVHYTCSVFQSQNTNMGPQLHPYSRSKQLFFSANKNSLWFFQLIIQDRGIAKYLLPHGVDSSGFYSNIKQAQLQVSSSDLHCLLFLSNLSLLEKVTMKC